MSDPLEDKLNGIFAMWDAEDEEEAKDDLESGADAMALADPATWAEHDAANREPIGPMQEAPEMEGAEPLPDDPPPLRTRAPTQARGEPAPAAPKPKAPKDMDWKELQQALQNAQMRANSSRNAEHMFENIAPGYKTDPGRFDKQVAHARTPLDVAKERQGMEARELSMQGQRNASTVKAAMDDPNSLQSQKAREAWRAFGLKTFPGFDNASANDIQRMIGPANQARAADNAMADDQRKVTAAHEKAEAEKGALANSRTAFAGELRSLGIDPEHASQKDIDRAISLKHAKANEAIAASNRRDKDDDQAALGESIPFAGGELVYSGRGRPIEQDKRKAVEIASGWNAALSGMDQLEKSLAAYAAHPGADTKRDVDSKVRVVSSALNSAIGGGAMSQDEAVAMSQALGADLLSPTGIEAFARSVLGDDPGAAKALTTRLRSVRESAKATALGKLQSYRFGMGGGGPSSGGKVKVSNGKETLLIDAADVAEAEGDGFKVVR